MTRPVNPVRPDIHTRITRQIIAQLEAGVRPWVQPWKSQPAVSRPLRHDGTPYSGINILLLWSEACIRGFSRPTWMTFRQARALGGNVRKGERGSTVVFASQLVRSEVDDAGQESERHVPFLKAYTVFNLEQIEGLPARFDPEPAAINPDARIGSIEDFFAGLGAEVRHGGDHAFYAQASDHVQMPPFEHFHSADAYYATLSHELTHWTKHPARLDRDFGQLRFGDPGYAREELVAELGAAFLCADLGLSLEPREDHAAYVAFWLKVLREDSRFIVSAAAHAQRAVAWLHGQRTSP